MPDSTIAAFNNYCEDVLLTASKRELLSINMCRDDNERQRKIVRHVLQLHGILQREMLRLMRKLGKVHDISSEMNNMLFAHINNYKNKFLR